jgi:hypothetical protein
MIQEEYEIQLKLKMWASLKDTLGTLFAKKKGTMAMSLEEEIAVLKNQIADYEIDYQAAKKNGNEPRQDLLLTAIAAARNNLSELRLEKQGNRNQSAVSRGIKGIQFSSLV